MNIIDAIHNSNPYQVSTILKANPAAAYAEDPNGNTTLMLAVQINNMEILKILLNHDVQILYKKNNFNQTVFDIAAQANHDAAKTFLQPENLLWFYLENEINPNKEMIFLQLLQCMRTNNKLGFIRAIHTPRSPHASLTPLVYLVRKGSATMLASFLEYASKEMSLGEADFNKLLYQANASDKRQILEAYKTELTGLPVARTQYNAMYTDDSSFSSSDFSACPMVASTSQPASHSAQLSFGHYHTGPQARPNNDNGIFSLHQPNHPPQMDWGQTYPPQQVSQPSQASSHSNQATVIRINLVKQLMEEIKGVKERSTRDNPFFKTLARCSAEEINYVIYPNDRYKCTPLMYAVYLSRYQAIVNLLRHGATPNTRNKHQETPIMHAKSASVVNALVKHQAGVNAQDEKGWSPFHHAADARRFNSMEALIRHGANIHLTDKQGRSVFFNLINDMLLPYEGFPYHAALKLLINNNVDIEAFGKSDPSLVTKYIYQSISIIKTFHVFRYNRIYNINIEILTKFLNINCDIFAKIPTQNNERENEEPENRPLEMLERACENNAYQNYHENLQKARSMVSFLVLSAQIPVMRDTAPKLYPGITSDILLIVFNHLEPQFTTPHTNPESIKLCKLLGISNAKKRPASVEDSIPVSKKAKLHHAQDIPSTSINPSQP